MLPDKVDLEPLITKLVERSREGKIPWQATAEENAFVAAIGRGGSLRVRLKDISPDWDQNAEIVPVLDLFDESGKRVWSLNASQEGGGSLWTLHELAQRVGNRVDERVGELLSALDELD